MTNTPATVTSVTSTLDCSGLLCPLPVYKAGIALDRMQNGDILELITTDPGALEDIPALARQRGETLLASEDRDGTQRFWLQKGGTG